MVRTIAPFGTVDNFFCTFKLTRVQWYDIVYLQINRPQIIGLLHPKVWIEGRLGYNDRYGLLVSDLWEDNGFHCGECLQVQIDGEWVDTSMEMDWSTGRGVWYLTGTDIRGEDIEYTRARIQKEVW